MASLQPIELDVTVNFDGPLWLVWSNEHRRWWGPNRRGYTLDVFMAGRYTLAEASSICDPANVNEGVPDEVIVPSPELVAKLKQASMVEAVA